MVENYPLAGVDSLFFSKGSFSVLAPIRAQAACLFHVEHLPFHRTLGLAITLTLTLALFHVEQRLAPSPIP